MDVVEATIDQVPAARARPVVTRKIWATMMTPTALGTMGDMYPHRPLMQELDKGLLP
jgi:hypothetical protein